MKVLLILSALLMPASSVFASEEVHEKWIERGRIAAIKLEGLSKKAGTDKKASYEYLLEFSYSMQIDKENRSLVHKTEAGIDFYKIMFKSPFKDGGSSQLFVINYMYEVKSGDFIGTKVEMLPKKWYLIQDVSTPGILTLDLNDDGYVMLFNLSDPFKTTVVKLR